MRVSGDYCRAQEGLHRARAASEPLENRQRIELAAAAAWALEAAMADKREARQEPLDKLDAEITAEFAREEADEQAQPPPAGA